MGNASIIRSVLLVLAACYDEPEIQLHVSRPDSNWNVEVEVCPNVPTIEDCRCADSLWNTDDRASLMRDVAIHINDDSERVTIGLHFANIIDSTSMSLCHSVRITDTILERDVDLAGPEYWSCAMGACEESVPCSKTCRTRQQ